MRLIETISLEKGENIFSFRIIPGAKETLFAGNMENGILKIRLSTIAEKGKANLELIAFLSKELGISQKDITILSGLKNQNKKIRIYYS